MELGEILLVYKKAPIVSAIGYILESKGYLVALAPDVETAAQELDNYHFDLILAFLTGNDGNKLDILRRAKERSPQSKVMVGGNPRKMTLPVEAFLMEVDDYLFAPFSAPELCRRVENCLRQDRIFNLKLFSKKKDTPSTNGDLRPWRDSESYPAFSIALQPAAASSQATFARSSLFSKKRGT